MNTKSKQSAGARNEIAPSVLARLESTARRLEREYYAENYNKAARLEKIDREIRRAVKMMSGSKPFTLSALDKVLSPLYALLSAIECEGNLLGWDDARIDAIYTNEGDSCDKEEATHVRLTVEKCGDSNNWELLDLVASLFGLSADDLENDSLDYDRASAVIPVSRFVD